jgi:hypothetical protein
MRCERVGREIPVKLTIKEERYLPQLALCAILKIFQLFSGGVTGIICTVFGGELSSFSCRV